MTHRALIVVATILLIAVPAPADTFVYLSVAAEKRIAVYRLVADTGKFGVQSD